MAANSPKIYPVVKVDGVTLRGHDKPHGSCGIYFPGVYTGWLIGDPYSLEWHVINPMVCNIPYSISQGFHDYRLVVGISSLKLTASSPLKLGFPKRKGNMYSNHPFSGPMLVSGREMILGCELLLANVWLDCMHPKKNGEPILEWLFFSRSFVCSSPFLQVASVSPGVSSVRSTTIKKNMLNNKIHQSISRCAMIQASFTCAVAWFWEILVVLGWWKRGFCRDFFLIFGTLRCVLWKEEEHGARREFFVLFSFKLFKLELPSLKLTAFPWKSMVGRGSFPFWNTLFSEANLRLFSGFLQID